MKIGTIHVDFQKVGAGDTIFRKIKGIIDFNNRAGVWSDFIEQLFSQR